MSDIRKFYVSTTAGQLHGRTLLARESNDNPTLLCLHPAPSSGLYFTTAMPLLNEGRNVIAPDYPGYGGSDAVPETASIGLYASAMLELLENYPVDGPVDILGFHTGCLVANEMALAAPSSVRRLVLCDVPYFTAEQQAAFAEKMAAPTKLTGDLESLDATWQFNVASRVGNVSMPRTISLLAEHLRVFPEDHQGFAAAFSYDCVGRYAELDADVVVLATRSGLLDATHTAADAITGATLVDVEDVTTAVFESGAPAISRHILAALDE